MQYIKVAVRTNGQEMSDILVAELSELGFSGFEEGELELIAYAADTEVKEPDVRPVLEHLGARYEVGYIPAQNWNAIWEANFEPVVVEGFCTVRAGFHDIEVHTPYEIIITPKMSFGTGHHATTRLVMSAMSRLDFSGKTVLDFGCGTGILAILAEQLGAAKVEAIDNDEWAGTNTSENVERNSCRRISVRRGSIEDVGEEKFDVILANINRHILLQYMQQIHLRLNSGGYVIMSGILSDDRNIVINAAVEQGLTLMKENSEANWVSLVFEKK